MCIITTTCGSMRCRFVAAAEIYGRTLARLTITRIQYEISFDEFRTECGRKWNRHHSKMVECLCTEVAIAMTRLPITWHSFHFAAKTDTSVFVAKHLLLSSSYRCRFQLALSGQTLMSNQKLKQKMMSSISG